MTQRRLTTRVARLESHTGIGIDWAEVDAWAAEVGCTRAELVAEADALVRQFAREGATTWDERLAIVARDREIEVADLRAELVAMGVMPA